MPRKPEFSHVRFFPTTDDLRKEVLEVLRVGDYIHASRRGFPLWTSVQEGVVTKVLVSAAAVGGISIRECENLTIPSPGRFGTQVQVTRWHPKEKPFPIKSFRGFRIDQTKIWTSKKGTVKKYNLTVGAATRPGVDPVEFVSGSSHLRFLREVEPGDYLTIWSEEDKTSGLPFLHYPAQGWVVDKNLTKEEVSYIHPPRMEVQTFRFRDHPNCQQVVGFYRKLVLQLTQDEAPVQPRTTTKKVR